MEKVEFLKLAIEKKKEIAAFHFNETYMKYADKFHRGKSRKTTMADFKKNLKKAALICGVKIWPAKCDYIDKVDFGIKTIWTIIY